MLKIKEPSRRILLGMAGHIDHGKSSLVKMFTGCETDRLPEEKKRGMTIDLGFASCMADREMRIGVVDVPGHERFIRNMVAGVAAIDMILLVVAADDGVMPQTREHLQIVELLGKTKGMVAVTKIDMVEPGMVELVVEELTEFLKGTFLQGAPITPLSCITGEGYQKFWQTLRDVAATVEPRDPRGVFRMPVERVFSVKGIGTVATGMPLTGTVKIDEKIELLPLGKTARVRGLQVFKNTATQAMAGDCVAMNLPDLDHNEVRRGLSLSHPGYFRPANMIDARFTMLPTAPATLKDGALIKFHVGTAEAMGRIALLDRKRMEPGETGFVQVRLEEPVVVDGRDRFIIRLDTPSLTIGGGIVIREQDKKLRRFKSYVIEDLAMKEKALESDDQSLEYALRNRGTSPGKIPDLTKASRLPEEAVKSLLEDLVLAGTAIRMPGDAGWLHEAGAADGADRIESSLLKFHDQDAMRSGMPRAQLRAETSLERAVFDYLVEKGAAAGSLVCPSESTVGLTARQPVMDDATAALVSKTEALFREAGFSPPGAAQAAEAAGVDEARIAGVLANLVDRGLLADLGEGIFFHRDTVEAAKARLVEYLREHGEIGAVTFRDLVGASRKFVYPLLDYFDLKGVTVRRGNLRLLKGIPQENQK